MKRDILWQVFIDTGDPLCWLLHRAAAKYDEVKEVGDKPRSA